MNLSEKTLASLEWDFIQSQLTAYARSSIGKQFCTIHKPSFDEPTVHALQVKTKEAYALLQKSLIHSFLSDVSDANEFFERAGKGGILRPGEIFVCGHFIESLAFISKEFESKIVLAPTLSSIFSKAPRDFNLAEKIRISVNSLGEILDTASVKLASLRAQRVERKSKFESFLSSKIKAWSEEGLLQDQFYDVIDSRYVVPVKVEHQSKLGGSLLGKSNTGLSVYLEPPELNKENNGLKELELEIKQEEKRILQELSSSIGSKALEYAQWISPLSELDFHFSAAEFSKAFDLHPINEDESDCKFSLQNLFHPKIKATVKAKTVLNTVSFQSPKQCLMISGPNTGGKTVLLKAVGLSACLLQAGILIPVDKSNDKSSHLPIFKKIFALIGDDQDIGLGLSSFSSQMKDFKSILDEVQNIAGGHCLILIDEILSSTNPEDASALSQAFLEELLDTNINQKNKNFIFVTTHFSDLAIKSKSHPKIQLGAMAFDNGLPTYELRLDELGSSHALEVAETLGFPKHIVNKAKKYVSNLRLDYENAVSELKEKETRLKNEFSNEIQKLEEYKAMLNEKAEADRKLLEIKLLEFLKSQEELLSGVLDKLTHPKTKIGKERAKETVATALSSLQSEAKEKFEGTILETPTARKKELETGDDVRVISMNRSLGKIIEINGPLVIVQVGGFKLTKSITDLEFHEPKSQMRNPYKKLSSIEYERPKASQVSPKLDLRGIRFEDALRRAEKYLDEAYRSGVVSVTIVTGHGTGAIKSGVRDLLKSLPYVKEIQNQSTTDDGASIVVFES